MRIERFDGRSDPDRLKACYEIMVAGKPYDDPDGPLDSPAFFAGIWAIGYDGDPRQSWLARGDGDEPIACYLLILPERENTTIGVAQLHVAPARRRAGTGKALLAHCADQARRAGRSRLTGYALDGTPAAAFAAAVAAKGGTDAVRRVMDIDEGMAARLFGLRSEAELHADGYELLSWVGATPEEHIDQLSVLHRAMEDAPRDKGFEESQWDADRIRHFDRIVLEQGQKMYSVVGRHRTSGDLAGFTQVAVDPGIPGWAFQQITAVTPAHRGHRLGLLVKIAMLDVLAEHEPGARRIITGNAGANGHMIAINELLGYYVADVGRLWELDIAAVGADSQS